MEKEQKLWIEVQKRNQKAFENLFNKYNRYVLAIIFKTGGEIITNEDAEEICSDVFISLWNKANDIKLNSNSIKGYIAVMARNHTLNVLRSKIKFNETELQENSVKSPSAEEIYIAEEESNTLLSMIEELPEPDRSLFIQRYFYSEKVKVISAKNNLNIKTVGSKLTRAKKKLQNLFYERGM